MAGMSLPEDQKLVAALQGDDGNIIDHSKSSAFIVDKYEQSVYNHRNTQGNWNLESSPGSENAHHQCQ